MMSALVCMITHWKGPRVNHDMRLSDYHDSPIYYVALTLNLERILSLY